MEYLDDEDFFLDTLSYPEGEFESFLDRQIAIREKFKEKEVETSKFLDVIYMLYILQNKKTGKHFVLKRKQLEKCLEFASHYKTLDFEKNILEKFLK